MRAEALIWMRSMSLAPEATWPGGCLRYPRACRRPSKYCIQYGLGMNPVSAHLNNADIVQALMSCNCLDGMHVPPQATVRVTGFMVRECYHYQHLNSLCRMPNCYGNIGFSTYSHVLNQNMQRACVPWATRVRDLSIPHKAKRYQNLI